MDKVVALRYDRQKNKAPEVVASGQGLLAAKILELAKASDIPLYQHSELVDLLASLPVNSEIPSELYTLVAEVFAFILGIDEQQRGNEGSNGNG